MARRVRQKPSAKESKDLGLKAYSSITNYYELQLSKQEFDQKFEDVKSEFYDTMNTLYDKGYFTGNKFSLSVGIDTENSTRATEGSYLVTRVQRESVEFDVKKLEKKLSKDIKKKVIVKNPKLIDFDGLLKYVKSLGGDPKTFKSFFIVEKEVDEKELNRLSEIGEVSISDIEGCFEVKSRKPYYRLKFKADEDGNE